MGELALRIVLHAGLGLVLALLVTAAGLGVFARLRGRDALRGPDAVYAYPFGLAACVGAAVLYLVSPWLAPVAAVVVAAPVAAFVVRPAEGVAARAGRPFVGALPGALGLALALGILFHGPTPELQSRAYGDMLYYVNKLVSAAQSITPFRDLLVEGEEIIYAEAAPSFLGAALADLPGLDPILFHTTTLPAFLLASLALGLGLLSHREPRRGLPIVALLAVPSVIYPTWIAESPPIALALPLGLAIYRLWEAPPATVWLGSIAGLCGLELLATKVVATIPLAVVIGLVLFERYRDRLALVAGGVAVAGALAIALLFLTASWYTGLFAVDFLPADAVRGVRDQFDTRSAQSLSPTFEIAGQLLLLTALVRIRQVAFAASLAVSICAVWFVGGQGFDAALGTSVLLAAVLLWRRAELLDRCRGPVLGAAATLVFSAWLRDIAGIRAALVLAVLLATAWLGAFEGTSRSLRALWRRLLPIPAVGLLLAFALATGVDLPRFGSGFYPLTTDDYDIWRRVEQIVPSDGLVFTSMTGTQIDGRHGWNNYPSIAGRQLYLAGWYDGRLVSDRAEVARRLALNRDVLAGARPPTGVRPGRRFRSYYAVLRRDEDTPDSFRLVHANRRFALYRIDA